MIVSHLDDRNLSAKTGVIDENIDATERFGCTFDKCLHIVFDGHVTRNTDNTKFRRRFATTALVLIGNDNLSTFFNRTLRRLKTNTRSGCRGDKHPLASE